MVELVQVVKTNGPKCGSVLFFHGLNGDPYTTWGARNKDETGRCFWPARLGDDLAGLSVYSVGYCAHITGSSPHFYFEVWKIFELLLNNLELQDGPLYLIGHSLGGLVIKQLIRTADGEALVCDKAQQFLQRLQKIVFLATPHRGAKLAGWADRFPVLRELQSATTDELDKKNPHLRDLHMWYRNWANSRKIPHLAMYETEPLSVADLSENFGAHLIDTLLGDIGDIGVIVDKESANPGLAPCCCKVVAAKDCNHFNIAKPEKGSPVYITVCDFLRATAPIQGPRIPDGSAIGMSEGARMAA